MTKQININHLRINDERIKQYVDTETAKAGKHEIVNSAGTALPTEPNIRFNGLDATDNAQDATSEISAKGLNADDLAEIVGTTPANYAVGNTAMYSTTEQIVGRWIDGKPVYQKTVTINITASAATSSEREIGSLNVADLNIDKIIYSEAVLLNTSNSNFNQMPVATIANGVSTFTRLYYLGSEQKLQVLSTGISYAVQQVVATIKYIKTGGV